MERQIPEFALGVLVAPLMGGPGFMAGLGLMAVVDSFPEAIEVTSKDVAQAFIFLPMSVIPGWILAILPCLIGTIIMARIGATRRWARAPMIWALAGLLPTMVVCLINIGFTSEALAGILIFGTPSIICALVCRKLTSWRDPLPVMEEPKVPPAVAV
jgi:hypothetical protein